MPPKITRSISVIFSSKTEVLMKYNIGIEKILIMHMKGIVTTIFLPLIYLSMNTLSKWFVTAQRNGASNEKNNIIITLKDYIFSTVLMPIKSSPL